jgi:hypothetical protein
MSEIWIGVEQNTSGTYVPTPCPEISIRRGGPINAQKLYKFQSRFGEEYYISDVEALDNIDKLLANYDSIETYEYLYKLVIEEFGVMEFIINIGHVIANEHEKGLKNGKIKMQKQMRELLGLR